MSASAAVDRCCISASCDLVPACTRPFYDTGGFTKVSLRHPSPTRPASGAHEPVRIYYGSAWIGEQTDSGLPEALTTWFGPTSIDSSRDQ